MDPFENTIQRLAAKFQCSPLYVSSIAPMSKRMSWLTANQIPLSQLNRESERKYALLMAKHRPKKSESLKTYENAKKQYYRNSYRDNGDRMDIITSSMTKYN